MEKPINFIVKNVKIVHFKNTDDFHDAFLHAKAMWKPSPLTDHSSL